MLQELVLNGKSKEWERSATLEGTKAAGGEGLCAAGSEDEVAVFYAHEGKSVHQVLSKGGQWTGEPDSSQPEKYPQLN